MADIKGHYFSVLENLRAAVGFIALIGILVILPFFITAEYQMATSQFAKNLPVITGVSGQRFLEVDDNNRPLGGFIVPAGRDTVAVDTTYAATFVPTFDILTLTRGQIQTITLPSDLSNWCGKTITFQSLTAFAHVISFTAGQENGSAATTITLANTARANVTLKFYAANRFTVISDQGGVTYA